MKIWVLIPHSTLIIHGYYIYYICFMYIEFFFLPVFKFVSLNFIFFVWISGTLILMRVLLINEAWQTLTVSDNWRIWRSSSSKPGFWDSRCWVSIRGNSFLIKWWCYDYVHVFNEITLISCMGGLKGVCVDPKGMSDKKAMSYSERHILLSLHMLHAYAISFLMCVPSPGLYIYKYR